MSDCHEYELLLDAYVDGEIDGADRARVEEHLAACGRCREHHRALCELLRTAAGLSRAIAPERDLWPSIAGRLEAETVVPLRRRRSRWFGAAAAIAAAAVLALVILPRERASAPVAGRGTNASGVRPAVSITEQSFAGHGDLDGAAAELRRVLEENRERLAPETRKVIDDNLAIIDQAIANVKRALDEDPDNQALTVLLTATCQRKIDLLKIATEASRRT